MRFAFLCLFLFTTTSSFAFEWQDLWLTHDQQASKLMKKGDFSQANKTFDNPEWQAASAYRAGDYTQAAKLYSEDNRDDASYNEGNALAHAGHYEEAIKAYDKTLAINPRHQDANYNRKIVEELLKKDQKNKQNQDKQDKNKQNKDQQNKDQQDKDQQDKDKQDKDKQDKDKQDKDKQDKDKRDKNKQEKDKQDSKPKQSQNDREREQEKDQWLRLIPDDPGGLLRQKFLRDHLRRQHGWDQ